MLQEKLDLLQSTLKSLEKEKGIDGFQQTQTNLEKMSEQKQMTDESKAQTLQEISDIIQQLRVKVMDRKAYLSPLIQELRSFRIKVTELDSDYAERKRLYDGSILGIET